MKISALPDTEPSDEAANDETDQQQCYFGNSAGRPRAADKEARLHALLHTAAELFITKGYGKVSLEMIARAAHVAVRTIYVKFGGKAGLLKAVIIHGRAKLFGDMPDMATDQRPIEAVLGEFCQRFLHLVTIPFFFSMYRMVIAEAQTNPELAEAFFDAGPRLTRELLAQYFARADVRAQLREDLPYDELPTFLLNTVMGDQLKPLLFAFEQRFTEEEIAARVERGLKLFLAAVLR
jgi:TetR/AcrR family transcriptional repressor of mexJK operon